jgi:hypothetical protein
LDRKDKKYSFLKVYTFISRVELYSLIEFNFSYVNFNSVISEPLN